MELMLYLRLAQSLGDKYILYFFLFNFNLVVGYYRLTHSKQDTRKLGCRDATYIERDSQDSRVIEEDIYES